MIAALTLIVPILLLVTPSSHHLGSHERGLCHPVVPVLFHPGDPLFRNEQADSWTREQCAVARRERAVLTLLWAAPTVPSGRSACGGYCSGGGHHGRGCCVPSSLHGHAGSASARTSGNPGAR